MKKSILIIEDEEIIRDILKRKLEENDYNVEVAGDGEEGLQKMKEILPDIILLDIVMPKMDGIEVLEHMKESKDLAEIPVIVVSNSGQPVEIDKVRKHGVEDWIVKTEFDPQEVVDKVNTLLS